MIAVYAFLAMFTLQILMSVLGPTWRIRYWRVQAASIPTERLAQLYPGVDLGLRRERFFARYRALHMGIAALGLLLLGWLFSYMRQADWNMPKVVVLVCAYFLVQAFLPVGLTVWHGVRSNGRRKRSLLLEGKRKAILQRRGLFDFVSPFTVFAAALSYLVFAAFLIQHPFPGRVRLINLGAVTLAYALNAFIVYAVLYGKKPNPFETHEVRVRRIGLTVKSCVYSCIACVVLVSLTFALMALGDLKRWLPFALSAFFVFTALLAHMSSGSVPPRPPQADGLGSGGQATPATRDLTA